MSAPSRIELYEQAISSFLKDQLKNRHTEEQSISRSFAAELCVIYKLLNDKLKFKYRKEASVEKIEKNITAFTSVQIGSLYKLHWFSKHYTSTEDYAASSATFQEVYEIVRQSLGTPAIKQEQPLDRFQYTVLSSYYMRRYGGYSQVPLSLDILQIAEYLGKLIGFDHYDFGGIDAPDQHLKFNLFIFRKDHTSGFFRRKKQIHEHALLFELL